MTVFKYGFAAVSATIQIGFQPLPYRVFYLKKSFVSTKQRRLLNRKDSFAVFPALFSF